MSSRRERVNNQSVIVLTCNADRCYESFQCATHLVADARFYAEREGWAYRRQADRRMVDLCPVHAVRDAVLVGQVAVDPNYLAALERLARETQEIVRMIEDDGLLNQIRSILIGDCAYNLSNVTSALLDLRAYPDWQRTETPDD